MLSQDLAIPKLGGGAAQEASSATAWSEEAGSGGGGGCQQGCGGLASSQLERATPFSSSGEETEREMQKTVNKFLLFFHELC